MSCRSRLEARGPGAQGTRCRRRRSSRSPGRFCQISNCGTRVQVENSKRTAVFLRDCWLPSVMVICGVDSACYNIWLRCLGHDGLRRVVSVRFRHSFQCNTGDSILDCDFPKVFYSTLQDFYFAASISTGSPPRWHDNIINSAGHIVTMTFLGITTQRVIPSLS